MASPLPAGWTEHTNPTDQTVYYHNTITGVSQYVRPTDDAAAANAPPPPPTVMVMPLPVPVMDQSAGGPPPPPPEAVGAAVSVNAIDLGLASNASNPIPIAIAVPPPPPQSSSTPPAIAVEMQPLAVAPVPVPVPVTTSPAIKPLRPAGGLGFIPPVPSGSVPAHARTASQPPITATAALGGTAPSVVYFNIETSNSSDKSIQKGLLTVTDVLSDGVVMGSIKWTHLPRAVRVTGLITATDWLFKDFQREVDPVVGHNTQYHCENKTGALTLAGLQRGSFFMGSFSRTDETGNNPGPMLGAVIISPGRPPLAVDTRSTIAVAGSGGVQPQTPVSPNSASGLKPESGMQPLVLTASAQGQGSSSPSPVLAATAAAPPLPPSSGVDMKHGRGTSSGVVFGSPLTASVIPPSFEANKANASLLPAAGSNQLVSADAVFLTLETKNSSTAMVFRGRLFINSIDASGKIDGWLVRPPYQLEACAISGQTFPLECQFIEHQKSALVNGIDYSYTVDTVAGALTMDAISKPDFKASGTYRPTDAHSTTVSGEVMIAHANAAAWAELKAERNVSAKTRQQLLEEEAVKYPRDKHNHSDYFYCERCNHFVNKTDNLQLIKNGDRDCWHHPYPLSKRLRDAYTGEPLFACCRRPDDSRWRKMGWGGNGCSVAHHDTGACCSIM